MELKFRLEFPDLNDYTHMHLQHDILLGEFPIVPMPEEQGLHRSPFLSLQLSWLEYHQLTPNVPVGTDHCTWYSTLLCTCYLPILSSFRFIQNLEEPFQYFFTQGTHRWPQELQSNITYVCINSGLKNIVLQPWSTVTLFLCSTQCTWPCIFFSTREPAKGKIKWVSHQSTFPIVNLLLQVPMSVYQFLSHISALAATTAPPFLN